MATTVSDGSMSSAKYADTRPEDDWCTNDVILYSTSRNTGSQCSNTVYDEYTAVKLSSVQ